MELDRAKAESCRRIAATGQHQSEGVWCGDAGGRGTNDVPSWVESCLGPRDAFYFIIVDTTIYAEVESRDRSDTRK